MAGVSLLWCTVYEEKVMEKVMEKVEEKEQHEVNGILSEFAVLDKRVNCLHDEIDALGNEIKQVCLPDSPEEEKGGGEDVGPVSTLRGLIISEIAEVNSAVRKLRRLRDRLEL